MSFNIFGLGIVLVALVLIYGVYEYVRMAPLVKVGRTLARTASPFELTGDFPLHIMVLGDSTAVGVGSDNPSESVAGRLADTFKTSIENHARSGAKTADVEGQLAFAERGSYDLVILHIGANDVLFFTPGSNAESQLDTLLPLVKEKSSRVVLLTAGKIERARIIPLLLRGTISIRTKHMRERFIRVANKHDVEYVDLYALGDPFEEDLKRYYAPDMLHLSGDGYEVWYNHIKALIKERWPELYEN